MDEQQQTVIARSIIIAVGPKMLHQPSISSIFSHLSFSTKSCLGFMCYSRASFFQSLKSSLNCSSKKLFTTTNAYKLATVLIRRLPTTSIITVLNALLTRSAYFWISTRGLRSWILIWRMTTLVARTMNHPWAKTAAAWTSLMKSMPTNCPKEKISSSLKNFWCLLPSAWF